MKDEAGLKLDEGEGEGRVRVARTGSSGVVLRRVEAVIQICSKHCLSLAQQQRAEAVQ